MIKVVTLLFRKPGLTAEQFCHDYETRHRLLGEKYLRPHAVRYCRRYPKVAGSSQPAEGSSQPAEGSSQSAEGSSQSAKDSQQPQRPGPDFDVMMEVWFEDELGLQAAMAAMSTPEARAELEADEQLLFDRGRTLSFTVEEFESTVGL
jgi:hypothetical protein